MKYAHNYIGLQIKCEMAGRVFLGDVKNAYPTGNKNGDFALEVRHFNGESWPFTAISSQIEILNGETA